MSQQQQLNDKIQQNNPINNNLTSLQIVNQLVDNKMGYDQLLRQLKGKKNHNYPAFTKHLFNKLQTNNNGFETTFQQFLKIAKHFKLNDNVSRKQCETILLGFIDYWENIGLFYNQIEEDIIQQIQQISDLVYGEYVQFLKRLAQKDDKYEKLQQKIRLYFQSIHNPTMQQLYKIFKNIEIFNIDPKFSQKQLGQYITLFQYLELQFLFDCSDYYSKLYVQHSINKNRFQQAKMAIAKGELNFKNYPKLIQNQIKKQINFMFRTKPIYFLQIYYNDNPYSFKIFLKELYNRDKFYQLQMLMHKYNITKKELQIQDNRIQERKIQFKNILCQNDQFGATQFRVLGKVCNILELQDFGMNELDVHFINEISYKHNVFKRIMQSPVLGIDCQISGGRHVYDSKSLSITQISTENQIFIFDILDLYQNEQFKRQINELSNYKGMIIGQDIIKDIKLLLDSVKLTDKAQFILSNLIIKDIGEMFKTIYPNETKCNLQYLTGKIFKKELSKFQQCSNWSHRPLRKSQLHYAAFDAYLPIKIYQQLCKLTKKQKN